jgi:hypothetical protein
VVIIDEPAAEKICKRSKLKVEAMVSLWVQYRGRNSVGLSSYESVSAAMVGVEFYEFCVVFRDMNPVVHPPGPTNCQLTVAVEINRLMKLSAEKIGYDRG